MTSGAAGKKGKIRRDHITTGIKKVSKKKKILQKSFVMLFAARLCKIVFFFGWNSALIQKLGSCNFFYQPLEGAKEKAKNTTKGEKDL